MTPVRVVFPGRSDGINSGPSTIQLAHKKSGPTTQFYQEVAINEDKARDWRRKLGGMIIQQLEKQRSTETGTNWKADPDLSMTYILHEFPAGYRLFEHHTVHDGEGARDRRDTYLYGHPGGIKKRFRTPKEFFLHLWWLLTDESGNPDNCACKLCVSDELLREVEAFASQTSAKTSASNDSKPQPAADPSSVAPVGATAALRVQVPAVQPAPSIPSVQTMAPQITPVPQKVPTPQPTPTHAGPSAKMSLARPNSSGRSAPQSKMQPSAIPTPRNAEQLQDTSINSFLYRVGELVWYTKGQAVGLAVIKGRSRSKPMSVSDPLSAVFFYSLQPLSYPGAAYQIKVENESQMKPWYAYSPPSPTHQYLNRPDVLSRPYNAIDWDSTLAGQFGPGDTDVDASIFAAKSIDRSYTPIECINNTGMQLYYNGIYLGGEKIWRGDAVTLRSHQPMSPGAGQPLEILIVTDVVETIQAASIALGQSAPANSVHLVGDRYSYTSEPINIPSDIPNAEAFLASRIPTRIPVLPVRVAEDLVFQNTVSVPRKQVANSWRLIAAQTSISAAEIRGRWYETVRMLPIINPANFQRMRDVTGDIHDVGRSLNARGEASDLGPTGSPGSRYSNRIEVLSRSVPTGFKLEVEN